MQKTLAHTGKLPRSRVRAIRLDAHHLKLLDLIETPIGQLVHLTIEDVVTGKPDVTLPNHRLGATREPLTRDVIYENG